jgi:hypothetical protein
MDEDYSNGNSFLDYLNWGGKTATGVLGALNKPAAPKPAAGPTNWTLIAGIGAAVLVVLVLVVTIGRK